MHRHLLGHLPIVLCVARHRAFATAAAELGMSPSAVSHAVRSVEDRLAIPLFARTTRSVSLTEAGERFIAGVEPALTDIVKTVEGLTAERGEVTGLLRIDAPRVVLEMALTQILAKLAQQHPRLTVEIRTGHTSVDIVAQGFDAGISIRRAIQQDMVTTRLTGPFKFTSLSGWSRLRNRCGRPPDTVSAAWHGAGLELIVGDGGAFDGAPNEVAVQPIGQIAAVEPVGPFPKIARQVLGADAVMSADEPGFDVAEQGMDDREELTGIGAVVLHHRGVRQMFAEGGIAAAIGGEPVGQEMGPRCDIRLEEGAEFDARRGWQNRDPGVAGEEAVLALHRVPVLSRLVLWCRHLLDGGDDQALVGAGRAAAAACRIAAAADEGLIRLEKAAQRTGRILAQPVAQLVRHGPGRLIRHPQFALQKFGRDAALVATHQVGGKKPLRQARPRPMKHCSRRHRFLPMAGGAFVDPRPRLQPPSRPPTAAGTHKTAGPAKPSQVLDAPLLRPEPGYKIQKSSHSLPLTNWAHATLRRGEYPEHLANLR